jgi:translation initiation factor 1
MAAKSNNKKTVWREFGDSKADAFDRPTAQVLPQDQNPRIQTSRKGKGGKTVTVITGLEHDATAMAALLKQLKNKCGTGGSVKDETLEIQGDHRQTLLELLTELGYKAKLSGG